MVSPVAVACWSGHWGLPARTTAGFLIAFVSVEGGGGLQGSQEARGDWVWNNSSPFIPPHPTPSPRPLLVPSLFLSSVPGREAGTSDVRLLSGIAGLPFVPHFHTHTHSYT